MVVRFLKEARAASKIKSVHVVRVTDVDTLEDGVPYMVMEHLTGVDFSELRKKEGKLGITDAVGYVLQACDALAEAHGLGIVHRDLKPGNLFLHRRKDGRTVVKVLDFGISKLESPGEQDTTKTGQMMGSPKYMSPKQMLSMHHVDGRSDIWSLGAILYEFFTGRPPSSPRTRRASARWCSTPTPRPPAPCARSCPPRWSRSSSAVSRRTPTSASPASPSWSRRSSRSGPCQSPTARAPRGCALSRCCRIPPTATPVLAASTAGVLPSVSPTLWDAVTKIEGPLPKSQGRRRVAAVLAGLAILGGLAALYATQSDDAHLATGVPPLVTGEAPRAEAFPSAAPSVAIAPAPTVDVVRPSTLADPPDAAAAPVKPHATSIAPAASFAKKARRPPTDPFGGSRN